MVHYHRKNVETLVGEWLYERFGEAGLPSVFSRAYLVRSLAELGDFAEGSARGAEAVRIAETVEQPFTLSHAYFGVGFLYLRKGDLHRAIPVLERGLRLCQVANIPVSLPMMASTLGAAYALAGRVAEALPLLEQDTSTRYITGQSLAVARLGEGYLLAGRLDEAMKLADRALGLTRAHQERGDQAYALRLLGDITARRQPPELDQAGEYYRQALALAEELGMRPLLAHCHLGLGQLYAKLGRRTEARAELSAAIELYRAMEMTFWLPRAEAALAEVEGR
jgi:tetratricopeptide (TPR) repeat protein